MRLPQFKSKSEPLWYEQGLSFCCQQTGNCCTGGPGYVWINDAEIEKLAGHLGVSRDQLLREHCRKIDGKWSLNERRTAAGLYDCVFLEEQKQTVEVDGQPRTLTRRICRVYPVRPLQCRTWPFWPENLASREAWDRASRRCAGMDRGRTFDVQEIHRIRDAADWPERPPTSGPDGG